MKIKKIAISMELLIACLSGQGDYRGRALNSEESRVIIPETKMHYCYTEVGNVPLIDKKKLLQELQEFTPDTFERLEKVSLPNLIQQLSLNLDNSFEKRTILLWLIREKINFGSLSNEISYPQDFRATWKDLLSAIKGAKAWADSQQQGPDAVKLHDSFTNATFDRNSLKYAKILADLLKCSDETWKFNPEFSAEAQATLVQSPSNPFDEKPSSFEQSNSSSSGSSLQAGIVASSVKNLQDLAKEMADKFPIEKVLSDKDRKEAFKKYLANIPENCLSGKDEYTVKQKSLKEFLEPIGYVPVKTSGIGNCLFVAVDISCLIAEGIYRPEYNTLLNEYLEQQQPYRRKSFADVIDPGDLEHKDLKNRIENNRMWGDRDFFPIIAKKLQKKITLVSYSTLGIDVTTYLPTGEVDIPPYHTMTSEEFFISAIAEDAILIAFDSVDKDFYHYVALRLSKQAPFIDEMVQRFSLEGILYNREVNDIKAFLDKLPSLYHSRLENEDKTTPSSLTSFLDPLGYIPLRIPKSNHDDFVAIWMFFCIEHGIYRPQYNDILAEFITGKCKGETPVSDDSKLSEWAKAFERDILLVSQYEKDKILVKCFMSTGQEVLPDHNYQSDAEFFNHFALRNAIVLIRDGMGHFTTVRQK